MDRDPLYEPLGTGETSRPRRVLTGGRLAGLAVLATVVVIGASLSLHRRPAGEEVAVVPIEPAPKPASSAEPPPVATATAPPSTPLPQAPAGAVLQPNGDTIEYQNGVKIVRMGPGRAMLAGTAPAGAEAPPVRLRPAPDPNLVERSPLGLLPRIGPDGLRPSQAYARPTVPEGPSDALTPRVAIMVGGLGSDPSMTSEAARRLPASVSFAFSPLGKDLPDQVAKSRTAGHEAILELPTPPHDPAGPEQEPADPLAGLHSEMSRFTGYAGTFIPVGSAFTSDASLAVAVARDIASRGLLLFRERSPRGSTPTDAAPSSDLQTGRVDVVVDGTAGRSALDDALSRLGAIARAKGQALLYLRLGPGSLDAVSAYVDGLAQQELRLVPASAVATGVSLTTTSARP